MIKQIDAHYQTLNLNSKSYTGKRWARKLITNVWTTLLQLWQQRTALIYETETHQTRIALRDKLETRIRRCYHFQDHLASNDRGRQWFDKEIQDKLQQDPQHLATWLLMTERLIRIAKRENKKNNPKKAL
jgi:hypothetical protein